MSELFLHINHLSFSYPSDNMEIISDLSVTFPRGWSGIIGENGSGKTTLLRLIAGEINNHQGNSRFKGKVAYCEQRTYDRIPLVEDFYYSYDSHGGHLKSLFNIQDDWIYRWETLSFGERKKSRVAAALWSAPDLLLLDEPTNHLDRQSRQEIIEGIKNFKGIGLIVSHDRDLLDTLCDNCLFLTRGQHFYYRGNFSTSMGEFKKQNQNNRDKLELLRKEKKRLEKEFKKAALKASQARRKVSKKGISPKDHDMKAKKDLIRLSGKDKSGGDMMNRFRGRIRHVEKESSAYRYIKDRVNAIHLENEKIEKDFITRLQSSLIHITETKQLRIPETEIRPGDKIALKGPNGAGKTTLLNYLYKLHDKEKTRAFMIPQEMSSEQSRSYLKKIQTYPKETLGKIMSLVDYLGTDPERLFKTTFPSPGEIKKTLIAQAVESSYDILYLDEPENHLDIFAVEILEKALSDYQGALLMVSHDMKILKNIPNRNWKIEITPFERKLVREK